ncbi:MAG: hypothetical protein AB1631_12460 [Acidobacteriota bacterium]
MNHARVALLIAICLLISLSAFAQQAKRRAPSLSTDDVVRSNPASTSSPSSGEWTRYSPGNSTFSLELPGEPQPMNLPLPPEAQRQLQSSTGYVYTNGSMVVVIAHLIPKKGSVAAAQLKDFAAQLSKGDALSRNASIKVIDDETVLISQELNTGGNARMEGLAKSVGGTVWMIMTVYQQGDETSQALARRVIDSATFE